MTTAYNKFYINGEWVEPGSRSILDVINPAKGVRKGRKIKRVRRSLLRGGLRKIKRTAEWKEEHAEDQVYCRRVHQWVLRKDAIDPA